MGHLVKLARGPSLQFTALINIVSCIIAIKIPAAKAAEFLTWKKSTFEDWCKKMNAPSKQTLPF